jgi:NADP-dependent 3-hydroxy acid dehydrogenase YdfG
VSPGVVETEFMAASGRPVDPKQIYSSLPHLKPKDIADAVLYVLAVPPHVQVYALYMYMYIYIY